MMIYRRIADSILSHKITHKSIKGLDKVASRHIIACRLSPVACRLSPVACRLSPVACRLSPKPYPKHNNTTFFSHNKRIEGVLPFRYAFLF